MSSMEQIRKSARRLDNLLSRHGYLANRASEHVIVKPHIDPRLAGDHARWMVQELRSFRDPIRANRWLRFVEGICWTLGVRTIAELQEVNTGKEELFS